MGLKGSSRYNIGADAVRRWTQVGFETGRSSRVPSVEADEAARQRAPQRISIWTKHGILSGWSGSASPTVSGIPRKSHGCDRVLSFARCCSESWCGKRSC